MGIINSGDHRWRKIRNKPPVTDIDNVPEILCDGPLNVTSFGNLTTLTFTNVRPEATALLGDGTMKLQSIVRARIVLTSVGLVGLRDLLNRAVQESGTAAPPVSGAGAKAR